ncbi:MAG: inositol monophosphatase family protein [Pseudonocardiales bacterium]
MTIPRPIDPNLPSELERFAVELAQGAAAVVAAHGRGSLAVSSKSTVTDLVTAADRASELWLAEQIAAQRPADAILGEEGAGSSGTSGVRWLLDPIDGTVNYVLGLPLYAVSVAAEVDGQVQAAAVCNAASGELFRAHAGGGAYVGSARLGGPRLVELPRAVVGTGFSYDAAQRARQGAVVSALLPRVGDIRRLGSASLDLCAVAAGRLDAYFEAGLQPWDYAAGVLIATEAGCAASGLRQRPPSPQFTAVAAASLSADLFDLLEELGADTVSS